ncbi:MAG: helix-turn-helix transcriptional regulator [bacterium]|nr:MAG: helix-turn-helix transcriptional regulator [bacterium]
MRSAKPGRRERRKEELRSRIIDRATKLFEEHGFENVTMERIAEAADVAKGTLYNHFPVKEAILSGYVQKHARDMAPEIDRIVRSVPDTRSRLVALLQVHARWIEDRKELMEKYIAHRISVPLRSLREPSARSGFAEHITRVLALGQEAGDVRRDLDANTLSGCLTSFYTWVYFGWLSVSEAFDIDLAIRRTVDLFLDGAASGTSGDS